MGSARSVVEAVGDGIELVLTVDREVGALGQVLAQQPVGVLAGAALPWAVRVAEVHAHAGGGAELLVTRHLLALVVGQALAHRCGDGIELGREACQRRGGGGIFHLGQQHQAAGALDQHADGGLVASAFDEVAFPVARHDPVVDLGRAHVDADHIGDLAAAVSATRARHARAAAVAQTGDELAAQLARGWA